MIVSKDFVHEALEGRFAVAIKKWPSEVAEFLWPGVLDLLEEIGEIEGTPSTIVDNFIVNGDYGTIDEYRKDGESDQDVLERVDPLLTSFDDEGKLVLLVSF